MSLPRISLQTLDAFEHVARSGSVQIAAHEMKLSISSVSHHIARLEQQVGAVLFNRSSRPFTLTREGAQVLQHLTKGMLHIRRIANETAIAGLLNTGSLRIGIIEEFESTVTPELATFLTTKMPNATLSISNILSHQAAGMLEKGEIDLAIISDTYAASPDLKVQHLLHDPFVMAVPEGVAPDRGALLEIAQDLAFLRFNQSHLIGKQIEAQLARNNIDLPARFEFDSVQSIMAIIANGAGWAIVTPLGFMRAQRFAQNVRLQPLPLPAFARDISLLTRADFDVATVQAITDLMRQIIDREVVVPAVKAYPWLSKTLLPSRQEPDIPKT